MYHYAGPRWRALDGSITLGTVVERVPKDGTIPWLLLYADEVDGAGMVSDTTFIQRLNTTGGKAPTYMGPYDGYWIGVPYTAEYYFYRSAGAQPREAE